MVQIWTLSFLLSLGHKRTAKYMQDLAHPMQGGARRQACSRPGTIMHRQRLAPCFQAGLRRACITPGLKSTQ